MIDEYLGKLYRNADCLFLETTDNKLIKLDVNIDNILAKNLLLGKQDEYNYEKLLAKQFVLVALKRGGK